MTQQYVVGLTSPRGERFVVSGRTALEQMWFRGGGLRHAWEGDAWREYGGNTAHLPDANLRAFRRWDGPSTVDLGAGRSDGWREGRGGGKLGRGIYKGYSDFNNAQRGF